MKCRTSKAWVLHPGAAFDQSWKQWLLQVACGNNVWMNCLFYCHMGGGCRCCFGGKEHDFHIFLGSVCLGDELHAGLEKVKSFFNVYGPVHCKYIPIYFQKDATLHSLFIFGNCSTCFRWYLHPSGARGGAVGWGTALQVGRSRVRFPMVSLDFFIDIILPAALWPWGWLSL